MPAVSKKTPEKNTAKTEVVTLRLDPKTRFGLELLARKQYRTLSSVVEWAINSALHSEYDGIPDLNEIWDVEEADRLVKLALRQHNLLNYEEQIIWKLISENGYFWKGYYKNKPNNKSQYWVWNCMEDDASYENIRQYLPILKEIARGEKDKSSLPKVANIDLTTDSDDEIPF